MLFGVIFLRLAPTQPTVHMVFKETKKKIAPVPISGKLLSMMKWHNKRATTQLLNDNWCEYVQLL